jgi:hypothetical protein
MGIVLVAIISLLLCVVALHIYSHQLKGRAEKVLSESYEFSTGKHAPTLADLRQRFGTELKQPDPCTASGCKYEIMLSNRALARLHLSPYTALRSSFWVRDDSVQENVLQLWTLNRKGRMMVAYADARYCDGCKGFDVVPCEGFVATLASGSVMIGFGSGRKEKRAAFGFDPSCLTSFRGCGSVPDLAPTLWRVTASGAVQCTTAEQQ